MANLWRLRLGACACGLLLWPWARIRWTLGAWSSILGPNLFQLVAIRLSSNSSVDHWAPLQLLTFNVTFFISLTGPYILWRSTDGKNWFHCARSAIHPGCRWSQVVAQSYGPILQSSEFCTLCSRIHRPRSQAVQYFHRSSHSFFLPLLLNET